MKKILYSASIFALLATGCSKESFEDGNGSNDNIESGYSIIATMPEDDKATRAIEEDGWEASSLSSTVNTRISVNTTDGVTTWSDGAKVHLVVDAGTEVNQFTAGSLSDDAKTATLTGPGLIAGPQMIYGVHPAVVANDYVGGIYTLASITEQYNTLNKIAMVAYPTTVNTTSTTISERVRFAHLYSAMGVKFALPAGVQGVVKSVVIKNASDATASEYIATDLPRTINIKAADANFAILTSQAGEVATDINIKMQADMIVADGGTFEVYAKIYPTNLSGKELTFIVTLEDGKQYIATRGGTNFRRGVLHKFSATSPATALVQLGVSEAIAKLDATTIIASATPSTTTYLTVTGHLLTAVDYKYIRDNMPKLRVLDLSGAVDGTITASIIPPSAFSAAPISNIVRVVLPNSLPAGVTATNIGGKAFQGCPNFESINIPEGITTIAQDAFRNLKKMSAITLPKSLISLPANVFNGSMPANENENLTVTILNDTKVIDVAATTFPINAKRVKFIIPAKMESAYAEAIKTAHWDKWKDCSFTVAQ